MNWVLPSEVFSVPARALLTNLSNGLLIAGPPHLRGEVANALYQRSRSREPLPTISVLEARESRDDFLAFPVAVESPPRLYEESLLFALTNGLPSIYDSTYVVPARELGTDLWTADQRLLRTVSGVAPWVRSIAGYS